MLQKWKFHYHFHCLYFLNVGKRCMRTFLSTTIQRCWLTFVRTYEESALVAVCEFPCILTSEMCMLSSFHIRSNGIEYFSLYAGSVECCICRTMNNDCSVLGRDGIGDKSVTISDKVQRFLHQVLYDSLFGYFFILILTQKRGIKWF